MLIYGIDPGKTTGFVIAQFDASVNDFKLIHVAEIPIEIYMKEFTSFLSRYEPDYCIIEAFRLYEHKAASLAYNDFPSVEVIGYTKMGLFLKSPKTKVTMQMASFRVNVAVLSDHMKVLKSFRHATDAYKHVRGFVLKNHKQLNLLLEEGNVK